MTTDWESEGGAYEREPLRPIHQLSMVCSNCLGTEFTAGERGVRCDQCGVSEVLFVTPSQLADIRESRG